MSEMSFYFRDLVVSRISAVPLTLSTDQCGASEIAQFRKGYSSLCPAEMLLIVLKQAGLRCSMPSAWN